MLGGAGVTLRSVTTAMGLGVTSVTGTATGSFDASLAKLAQFTERYCVVAQSLATAPVIEVRRAA